MRRTLSTYAVTMSRRISATIASMGVDMRAEGAGLGWGWCSKRGRRRPGPR
jgi:hypothetical protein